MELSILPSGLKVLLWTVKPANNLQVDLRSMSVEVHPCNAYPFSQAAVRKVERKHIH